LRKSYCTRAPRQPDDRPGDAARPPVGHAHHRVNARNRETLHRELTRSREVRQANVQAVLAIATRSTPALLHRRRKCPRALSARDSAPALRALAGDSSRTTSHLDDTLERVRHTTHRRRR
jgi:hypothetical protein